MIQGKKSCESLIVKTLPEKKESKFGGVEVETTDKKSGSKIEKKVSREVFFLPFYYSLKKRKVKKTLFDARFRPEISGYFYRIYN